MNTTYEVFAVKYAELLSRTRRDNFLEDQGDDHNVAMPLDYFVWVVRNDDRTIVVDTGFDQAEADRRGRSILRSPARALATLGVDANTVREIVITHMHYDHAGTLTDFPSARFHVQDAEMAFCCGPEMCNVSERHAMTPSHISNMIEMIFNDRVNFHSGDAEIAPGISLHKVPGHTPGMQCMSVNTKRGRVVLASDAAHFYENYEQRNPFAICWSLADMFQSFDRIGDIAESEAHVIPGHDPQVMQRYPAVASELNGIAVRLDATPAA
jgi:glyoxylase-like metal-dependent hydrolase (beta-lactamase superfamily II)